MDKKHECSGGQWLVRTKREGEDESNNGRKYKTEEEGEKDEDDRGQ